MFSKFNIAIFVSIFCILNLTMISVIGEEGDNTNIKDKFDLNSIPLKQLKVGDIVISYKIFGKGDPILLIMGYGGSMNFWEPILLSKLSKNQTVIVFDNRGVGNTTVGSKNFTIDQFAADSIGLLDALKINKSDILGYSMGGMIAQQLTLNYPNKVDDLIIYASTCGGERLFTPQKSEVSRVLLDNSGNDTDKIKRWIPLQLTEKWILQYPDYLNKFNSTKYPSNNILDLQREAMMPWFKYGVCDELKNISHDTLVITGTGDRVIPPENSFVLTEKIPGSSLVEIEEGGHKLMSQYPNRFTSEVRTFLEN